MGCYCFHFLERQNASRGIPDYPTITCLLQLPWLLPLPVIKVDVKVCMSSSTSSAVSEIICGFADNLDQLKYFLLAL